MEIIFICIAIIFFCLFLLVVLLHNEFNVFSIEYYYDLLMLLLSIFLLWGILFAALPI